MIPECSCRSRDGLTLMCCSQDGTVASIRLADNMFGPPLTKAERDRLMKETYGGLSLFL
jgi:hypothetical protein